MDDFLLILNYNYWRKVNGFILKLVRNNWKFFSFFFIMVFFFVGVEEESVVVIFMDEWFIFFCIIYRGNSMDMMSDEGMIVILILIRKFREISDEIYVIME